MQYKRQTHFRGKLKEMEHVALPPIIYPTVIEQVTHANSELPLPIEIIIDNQFFITSVRRGTM